MQLCGLVLLNLHPTRSWQRILTCPEATACLGSQWSHLSAEVQPILLQMGCVWVSLIEALLPSPHGFAQRQHPTPLLWGLHSLPAAFPAFSGEASGEMVLAGVGI